MEHIIICRKKFPHPQEQVNKPRCLSPLGTIIHVDVFTCHGGAGRVKLPRVWAPQWAITHHLPTLHRITYISAARALRSLLRRQCDRSHSSVYHCKQKFSNINNTGSDGHKWQRSTEQVSDPACSLRRNRSFASIV